MADSSNIVSIINSYAPLEKKGPIYRGFCPFCHSLEDKLVVRPDVNEWHCFQCGAGGNADDFVALYKGTILARPADKPAKPGKAGNTAAALPVETDVPMAAAEAGDEETGAGGTPDVETFARYYERLRKVTGYKAAAILDSNRQLLDMDTKLGVQGAFEKLNTVFIDIIDTAHTLFNEKFTSLECELMLTSTDGVALYLSTYYRGEPVHVIVLGSDKSQQYLMRMHAMALAKY